MSQHSMGGRAPIATAGSRTSLIRKLVIGVSAAALLAGASHLRMVASPPAHAAAITTTVPAPNAPGFADLVQRVKPAVVSVQVKMRTSGNVAAMPENMDPFNGQDPFQGTPFENFFKRFGMPHGQFQFRDNNGPNERNGPLAQALGSGFIISADGYVVTNNHVVDGATEVKVVTDDGKSLDAKVVGTDPKTDLALLKVESGTRLPYVHLAANKPRIGDWVLAMGNPFGLGGTVTAGIVSAEGRDIGAGPYDDFIQIDAPVNKGNSGGPTFNLEGDVIGVNTAIFSPSGGSVGIAFDIPAQTVETVVAELKQNGKVERAWLGVDIQPVTADIAESLGLKAEKGALVAKLEPDSPAAEAGLKSGDVISKVDGSDVEDARDLVRRVGTLHPGTKIEIGYIRDGKHLTVSVKLAEMKDTTAASLSAMGGEESKLSSLGLEVQPASSVAGAGNEGVVVTAIDANGAAAAAGLAQGDVILRIAGKDVASANDVAKALQESKTSGKSRALALVRHGDEQRFVPLPVAAG